MRVSRKTFNRVSEVILLAVAAITGGVLLTYTGRPVGNAAILYVSGTVFTASLIMVIRVWLDPDRVRASQSDAMLGLASQTFYALRGGLNAASAQRVCDILLPSTDAIAVAMTDDEVILGYAGVDKDLNATGAPIRTKATAAVIEDGQMRVSYTAEEIGFPESRGNIRAGIIVPLLVSDSPVGTLKFYYHNARKLTETQQSIARGFGELISTQVAAANMEAQKKLATSMELKALQSQINPHFLFNTINTISSFIRTDPMKARELLREFATFYRRALEDSTDLIPLAREVEQTARYLQFEIARFGEDRLQLITEVPEELAEISVPSFMIQPLVENSVKHAMPARGTLHITVSAKREGGDDLSITVADDGVGMSEEQVKKLKTPESSLKKATRAASTATAVENTESGIGIAVGNINDRLHGFYGQESHMFVESEEGVGTTIKLFLKHGCVPHSSIDELM